MGILQIKYLRHYSSKHFVLQKYLLPFFIASSLDMYVPQVAHSTISKEIASLFCVSFFTLFFLKNRKYIATIIAKNISNFPIVYLTSFCFLRKSMLRFWIYKNKIFLQYFYLAIRHFAPHC